MKDIPELPFLINTNEDGNWIIYSSTKSRPTMRDEDALIARMFALEAQNTELWGLTDEYRTNNTKFLSDLAGLRGEITQLQEWVNDLHSGMYINCVYCGHRYGGRADKIPREVLHEHIRTCPKHPLSIALKEIENLSRQLSELRGKSGQVETYPTEVTA